MQREWGWLKGGIALGILSAFAFITYKPLGVSTSYPRTVALALNTVSPHFVAENAYFQRVKPIVDWQLMLVVGIAIGGYIAFKMVQRSTGNSGATSARSGGKSKVAGVSCATGMTPDTGAPSSRRKWLAFSGGFLLLFGARLADGCTSGHVITGMTQMATASFLFAAAVFAVGIPVAKLVKRKGWA